MQRHFSSRGEAHAEAVAAKMSATHKPLVKPGSGLAFRRSASDTWQSQPPTAVPTKPAKK